jgi:hypothetical protein
MALDNLLAHRQPDPDSLVFLARVQTPEHFKDALPVLCRDANPIIFYSDFPLVMRFCRTQPHVGVTVRVTEFHGIGEQVLKQGA